jgi:hypothetical protein
LRFPALAARRLAQAGRRILRLVLDLIGAAEPPVPLGGTTPERVPNREPARAARAG